MGLDLTLVLVEPTHREMLATLADCHDAMLGRLPPLDAHDGLHIHTSMEDETLGYPLVRKLLDAQHLYDLGTIQLSQRVSHMASTS
jgi:hypothetical protein